jgi:hypothetical protein
MDAVTKTKALIRANIAVDLLVPQEINPNKMSAKEFNLLCANIDAVGFIDPVFVRPIDGGKYRVIGGYHRYEAGKLLGFDEVPCTIIDDPEFDEDLERFQITRMNMIRGKLDTPKFLKLYQSLNQKYSDDLLAESFGFADEDLFKKLIGQMSDSLPKQAQAEFKKAAEEIKTIDGLSVLLNKMFTKYGDTLPFGFMILDFGKQESVWLPLKTHDLKAFTQVATRCQEMNRGMDSMVRLVLQSIAGGGMPELWESLKDFPEVEKVEG